MLHSVNARYKPPVADNANDTYPIDHFNSFFLIYPLVLFATASYSAVAALYLVYFLRL